MRISVRGMAQRWEHGTLTQRSWVVQEAVDVYLVSEDCPQSQDCDLTPAQLVGDQPPPPSSSDPGLGNRASRRPRAMSEALQTPASAGRVNGRTDLQAVFLVGVVMHKMVTMVMEVVVRMEVVVVGDGGDNDGDDGGDGDSW